MARIRTDNVFGETTDDPLTSGAGTMNSAGLANLDVVSGGDEALITLDPNRVNGAPEIVKVTAHTSSATDADIDRGEFGTAAREHPLGTEWVHGPIGGDSTTFDDDADDQGDFVPMGEWEDYTPSNTNVTVGNGTQTARFMRLGRTIHFTYQLTFGSTTSFDGTVLIGLPVNAAAEGTRNIQACGIAEDGGSTFFTVTARRSGAGQLFPITDSGVTNASTPFTWTDGDILTVSGTYEAAA